MWEHNQLTKTERLERMLVEEIAARKLKPHDKFMSEAEIGKKFGINQTTIRHTLSRLSAKGVIYRISGKGTFVSPRARTTLILLVSESPGRPTPFIRMGLADFLEGLSSSEQSFAYGCYAISISKDEYLEHAREIHLIYRNLGGIIFFSDPRPYIETRRILFENSVPALYYGSDLNIPEELQLNTFVYPQAQIVELALSHLWERGYRRIGIVTGRDHPHRQQRIGLFCEWMSKRDAKWPGMVSVSVDVNFQTQMGVLKENLAKAREQDGIEAWFCVDDSVAYRFMNGAYRSGYLIPEDMAMVSVSNFAICEHTICPISSVEIPFSSDAAESIQMLSDIRRSVSGVHHRKSTVKLIERESSAAKARAA